MSDISDQEPENSSDHESITSGEDNDDNIPGEDAINQVQDNLSEEPYGKSYQKIKKKNIKDSQEEKESSDSDESEGSLRQQEEDQVIDVSKFKGQSKGIKIQKQDRSTPPFLTKYEKARVIGTRALQISKNSPIYVDPSSQLLILIQQEETSDPIAIAQQELYENKIPFIIRRYLPNGDFEDWELAELERLD